MTRFSALAFGALLFFAGRGNAQEILSLAAARARGPVEIRAEKLSVEKGGGALHAAGGVIITGQGIRLTAEEVSYAPQTGIAEANGEVTLTDEDGNELHCRRLRIDLNTQTGTVEHGSILLAGKGYRVWGERLRKTGPTSYTGEKGGFTTCDGTWPSWRVKADTVEVELDDHLVGRGAAFWVEGLPVVYLPYVRFPVKRQSGFLVPKAGYSDRDGAFWGARYYWAFADNADVTAELEYRSRRGWTEGLEFRYVLAENHEGSAAVTHLFDREDDTHRYKVKADHRSRFAEGSRVRLHVDVKGDDNYQKELGDTLDERSVERVESYLLGTHDIQQGALFGLFDYYQALESQQDTTLQTLPGLGLFARETPLAGPLYWAPFVRATKFWRREGTDGDRLEVNPGLAADADVKGVGVALRSGYRQNLYHVNDENTARGAGWAEASADALLVRRFGPLIHTVEPTVSLFWEESGRGGDPPRFDNSDEFGQATRFHFLVESRLLRRTDFAPLVGLDLETTYRLDGWDWRHVRAEAFWTPSRFLNLRADADLDPNRDDPWRRWSVRAAGRDRRGDSAFAEFRYLERRAEYLDAGLEWAVTRRLALQYRHRYSTRDRETLEQGYGLRFSHQCWELMLTFTRNLRDDNKNDFENRFLASVNLKGLTTIGEQKGVLP